MSILMEPFKVWNLTRCVKKAFSCEVDLLKLINKANDLGISGNKVVLEEDGTEIQDDDTLGYFSEKILLLLEENAIWCPQGLNSQTQEYEVVYTSSQFDSSSQSDTLSMSSGVLSTESCESNIGILQSKKLFVDYKISWNKLPSKILELLEQKLPLKGYLNDFIHFMVKEMRAISLYIPVPVMRQIAEQALSKYPKSLGTVNDDGDVNTEPAGITAKLVYHNNYLNRKGSKRNSDDNIKPSIIKKLKNLKEGCPNWSSHDDDNYEDNLEDKRIFLKENVSIINLSPSEVDKITKYFVDTYSIQRQFLNNVQDPPTVAEIQQKWPHLLLPLYAKDHFDILTSYPGINLISNLQKYTDAILTYSKHIKKANINLILEEGLSDEYAVLKIISSYFGEDINLLAKRYAMGTNINEIAPLSNSPWIAILVTK